MKKRTGSFAWTWSLGFLVACARVEEASQGAAPADAPTGTPTPTAAPAPGPAPNGGPVTAQPGAPAEAAYDGRGFIVHEWGTDTLVVGSDGSLQVGLHHEEEDLPPFVEDRLKGGARTGAVEVKMETPVTYFYSDKPRTVEARVRFPKGVFTQWFPRVTSMSPPLARLGDAPTGRLFDPALEPSALGSDRCREVYGVPRDGRLDWGAVEVLSRDPQVSASAQARMPSAPLEKSTWAFARKVASNALRTRDGDVEQFLFYRGLGSFEPPVRVTAEAGGAVKLTSAFTEAMGTVFVVDVGASSAAFREEGGVPARGTLATHTPDLAARAPLEEYEKKLGDRVTVALERVGLFHDEAVGMVNTWKRQWFRTPGTRVLYLLPQAWTDASIPLEIVPAPDRTRRVMLMRVEVLTPELERADVAEASKLASDPAAVGAFVRLGRFGEPRLRRALALLGDPGYGPAAIAVVTRPGLVSVARE